MESFLNRLKDAANETFTENGAATPRSSGSDCLDLFATIGALRSQDAAEIERMIEEYRKKR